MLESTDSSWLHYPVPIAKLKYCKPKKTVTFLNSEKKSLFLTTKLLFVGKRTKYWLMDRKHSRVRAEVF